MSVHSESRILSFIAGEDLSAYQYHFVKFGASKSEILKCGANERAFGILQNAPASGGKAEVAIVGGGSKLKVSEAISLGKLITSDASSRGEVVDAAGEWFVAMAMEPSTANGDVIGVEIILGQSQASDV